MTTSGLRLIAQTLRFCDQLSSLSGCHARLFYETQCALNRGQVLQGFPGGETIAAVYKDETENDVMAVASFSAVMC
jgi:hypothetical protein